MTIKRWRKTTWVAIAWSMAIGVWVLVVLARGGSDCAHERFRSVCATHSDVQKGIGIVVLGSIWLLGSLVLALIWFLTRPGDEG
jgi:hypothetical protein